MKIRTPALAALLLPLAALAQPAPLLQITDPDADDVGAGSLVYPQDSAFAPGDLDLKSLRAFADGADLRFEAAFRNPVRDPATARGDGPGNESLALFARRGFYAFNLDLYLDIDRVPGSGFGVTLPGRGARIDTGHAWDKAIVLTPRPELMRRQLRDALVATGVPAGVDAEAELDLRVLFATDVRVRGRIVTFTVPQRFVSAAQLAGASLVALVTAARLTIDTGLAGTLSRTPDLLTLGAQQPTPGRPLDGFGYLGDKAPASAVVDLLAPDARQQAQQLAPGAAITGLNRDNGYGATLPSPTGGSATATGWFATALEAVLRGPVAAPSPAPAPVVVPPAPAPVVAAPVKPREPAAGDDLEQRLTTLKRLRERGLISEDEYQQKRRELLERL